MAPSHCLTHSGEGGKGEREHGPIICHFGEHLLLELLFFVLPVVRTYNQPTNEEGRWVGTLANPTKSAAFVFRSEETDDGVHDHE